ncbi:MULTISPECIES: spore coat protein [Clostridium]|uniref:Spore coat protein n=2 Tax=Clostridium TaxID=1485 RepID=A0ABN4BAV0_9CLOT|nr:MULTISPECIES: spore coat protein [Clostridium]ADK15018.1 putative spore coat protein [Clostridium ljungdahlii DSM 13528]AGY74270.1 spore coat protein [Clostridium autoethanogenum DSM 10061]ALU34461.1 Coat F domain protein [Clostridium autoethanogenum DSM 10061]OAA87679.1 Spore coat protein F precursor [Clostridium ljungdahlii DSM 13528]OVY51181.1 Spore coat protein F precursor [Clostridium autoethanogenum]
MNSIIESLTGMDKMSDQVIATDFLIAAKSGIRNYSIAITETISEDVKEVLKKQLEDSIQTYETITDYMMKNGYYHPYNMDEQFKVDMKTTNTALNLTEGM